MKASFKVGIDIGSTTVKVVICDARGSIVFSRYGRHYARTLESIKDMLEEAYRALGTIDMDVAVTGSAGLGLAESSGLPFIQEVVASARLIRMRWPQVKTLIEIGGEDSKVVFFDERFHPDMRMNGSCAGGTGAFIDQMATLLGVSTCEFDTLAAASTARHTIASRCGVFAKTDVQSLLSNHVPREDIAAAVFHAVALQVSATLLRGARVREKVLFAGGPLHFFPQLRHAFVNVLGLDDDNAIVQADHPELIAALGAALCHGESTCIVDIKGLIDGLDAGTQAVEKTEKLPALFASEDEFCAWQARHDRHVVARADVGDIGGQNCFLGIDSGSTTTKIVLMDDSGRVVLTHYGPNHGDPIEAAREGLNAVGLQLARSGIAVTIAGTAVTGYGEDLIKAAFGLDEGVVETVAHFRAARTFDPDVSFILDIGGQDMKAIFIAEQAISDIQINEACSSGCGSFMETLARSLNYTIDEFATMARHSRAPFDLGTRCTVFMNSKIKQAQREGALLADIAAGLAYAVVKNSLHKVLKLTDASVLGDHIVVQGGTFRNPAVLRAFEILTGREAVRPDMAELMGAYGAAIIARENHHARPGQATSFIGFERISQPLSVRREMLHCRGCENNCHIARLHFFGGRAYVTGNRCEKCFSNRGRIGKQGRNLVAAKARLLFDRPLSPVGEPRLRFGIPRALNMYENFPFWCAYLRTCGFEVVLSSPSRTELFEQGVASVMSDNICFPGKLVHGHIHDLIEKGVDRIFYPNVVHEHQEHTNACNSYNCPVVTGYPDVIRSAMNTERSSGIPLDAPAISFKDPILLERQLAHFVKTFGVGRSRSRKAFRQALKDQAQFKEQLRQEAQELIAHAAHCHEPVVALCGRPYHVDPLINHGIPELLAAFGVHVITEDALPEARREALQHSGVLTQWAYSNRIMAAAEYVGQQENMRMVQLTSFGCGLDAVSIDEVRQILKKHGRTHMLIKIDEITNLGAVKIRVRSFLETAWGKDAAPARNFVPVRGRCESCQTIPDKIIIPWVSPLYSPLLEPLFTAYGYQAEVLPPPDRASVEIGLSYVNNDVCYPAAIIIGDIIKAFQSGRHDPQHSTIILSQTFGQCRASNYLPLMKKALKTAGYGEVAVISISFSSDGLQLGLPVNQREFVRKLALGLIFADALARLYYATAAREKLKGQASSLHAHHLGLIASQAAQGDFDALLRHLKTAVGEFNKVETTSASLPVVGVVGEIYVKYNAFANNHIVQWLWGQGVEVVIPSLLGFFTQCFVNDRFDRQAYLKNSAKDLVLYSLLEWYVGRFITRVEACMRSFRFYRPAHDLKQLAHKTGRTVSLANQAGEGWLLTAEMIALLDEGVNDIVCMQPFGCLANHVTGKGVSQGLKDLYPDANLLFLDMDAGHSEVNLLNRLHCMVMAAREERVMALGNEILG